MKIKSFLALILVILMLGFVSSPVLAGGGPQDSGCGDLPDPTAGKFIWGKWWVVRDLSPGGSIEGFEHYNIVIELRRFREVHVFGTFVEIDINQTNDLSLLDEGDLLDETIGYRKLFCDLMVEDPFGLLGIPVIKRLRIIETENGGEPNETMRGTVLIRVVPVE